MGYIMFDLVIILGDILVLFDDNTPVFLKYLAVLAIILLTISITMRILNMTGII
jgi:hypothetical protein